MSAPSILPPSPLGTFSETDPCPIEALHARLYQRLGEGSEIETWLRPTYDQATIDAERFRVIIDQVASLTDVSILHWYARLCS